MEDVETLSGLPARFWDRVEVGDCWEWTGAKVWNGYGQVWMGGRPRYVHRLAYEALVGEIAPGLQLDHLCRNRACLNPDHLEPVTNQVNARRGVVGRYSRTAA